MQPPRAAAANDPWVQFPRRNPGARLRLFCFPYAGGGASIYRSWPSLLPPEVEVVAVQPPGRENRLAEKPFADLRALVDTVAEVLPPYMDRPFVLFGHSNGGLAAFELARRLRAQGRAMPQRLIVSGRPAPQVEVDDPPVHNLPEDQFRTALRRFGGTPPEILEHEEIMSLVGPVLRADFALGETYHYLPEPPLDTPISAYAGQTDAEVPVAQVEAWREQTRGKFHLRLFPGGHFFVNENRDLVTHQLSRELRELLPDPRAQW
ncbi:MAG TPA: alpha/beta fold hydrolase [Longimicrobiaceae bacterium]|nr:alpha/beta fold hydrolase [Longimicrobiaceae bacterium]